MSAGPAAAPGTGKRALFAVVLLLGLWGAAEALSALTLVVTGEGPGAAQGRRDAAAKGASAVLAPGAGGARAATVAEEALHPYVGFVLNRDDRATYAARGVQVNEQGFFGPDPIQKRGPDRVIVAILGGSVAMLLIDRDTFPDLARELGAIPRFAGKQLVVLNLALGGFKQPQQLTLMSYLLTAGAEFDVVVNLDGFNEVALPAGENAAAGVSPLYPRGWSLRVRDVPTVAARRLVGEITYLERSRRDWAKLAARPPWRWSLAATLAWQLNDRELDRRVGAARRKLPAASAAAASFESAGPSSPTRSEEETYEELAATWRRGSVLLGQLCAANGISYYHFLQPNQYQPGSKVLTAEERRVAIVDDHPYRRPVERGYPALIRAGAGLAAQGVRFVDLSRAFAGVAEPIYTDPCCHMNARGRSLLARRIGAAIAAAEGRSR